MKKANDSNNQTQLEDQIQNLTSKNQELDNKWRRALADYQNLEKRVADQRSMLVKMATLNLLNNLLPIVDDLDRAAAHLNDAGINMITKQLEDMLREEGVTEIKALGELFDPQTMECVEVVSGEKDQVVKVAQKGYSLHDTILRPAKVEVGNGQPNTK